MLRTFCLGDQASRSKACVIMYVLRALTLNVSPYVDYWPVQLQRVGRLTLILEITTLKGHWTLHTIRINVTELLRKTESLQDTNSVSFRVHNEQNVTTQLHSCTLQEIRMHVFIFLSQVLETWPKKLDMNCPRYMSTATAMPWRQSTFSVQSVHGSRHNLLDVATEQRFAGRHQVHQKAEPCRREVGP